MFQTRLTGFISQPTENKVAENLDRSERNSFSKHVACINEQFLSSQKKKKDDY